MHVSGHEFLLVGYRADVSFQGPAFQWPEVKKVRVEKVRWAGEHWEKDGEPSYGVDQSKKTLNVELDTPQGIRVSW